MQSVDILMASGLIDIDDGHKTVISFMAAGCLANALLGSLRQVKDLSEANIFTSYRYFGKHFTTFYDIPIHTK